MINIGVDLGGTNIAAGLVDEAGKILAKGSVPTGRTRHYTEIIKDMAGLVQKLLDDSQIPLTDIHSIGVGSPGVPDTKNGVIIYNNNLGFRNVNIRKELQQYFDLPVYVDNDANCATIAESIAGAGKGVAHMIGITIGTGIGGGIVANGKIYSGFNGAGGELGHVVIQAKGEPCTCGRLGCWEAYSSATALIRMTKAAAAAHPESALNTLTGGDPEKTDAKTAFDAMRMGDAVGIEVIDTYIEYFADGLANMINIFQPELIVIAGGVSKEGETLLAPLREKLKNRTYCPEGIDRTEIKIAQMGNSAGIVGAAFIARMLGI